MRVLSYKPRDKPAAFKLRQRSDAERDTKRRIVLVVNVSTESLFGRKDARSGGHPPAWPQVAAVNGMKEPWSIRDSSRFPYRSHGVVQAVSS